MKLVIQIAAAIVLAGAVTWGASRLLKRVA
jgi:hypothetical protein